MPITKARRAELEAELLKTMDRQDSLKEELREKLADHREQVKLHAQKLRELRDILSGREPEQTVLPGAEIGEVKPSKARRAEMEAKAARPTARQTASGINWVDEGNDAWTGRSRSQARVYRVSAVKVTATGKLNWGWNLPGSSLHHGGQSGFDAASQAMAAAEKHELHYWPREPKKDPPIVKKNAGPYRPKGEIVRWAADRLAKRPPTFVIEQTGLRTKKAIVAKYGENATFEKGKPCPRPLGQRPGDLAAKKPAKVAKSKAKAKPFENVRWVTEEDGNVKGIASDGLVYEIEYHKTPDLRGYRWKLGEHRAGGHFDTIAAAQEDANDVDRIRQGQPRREAKPAATPASLSWTEGDGTLQVVVGSTTYRVQEITPTRWVLESKSARERAWHKEDVLASQAACEAWVMKRHPGATFAEACLSCGVLADQPSKDCQECAHGREDVLDDLVGTREDAVARHAAGKEVAR